MNHAFHSLGIAEVRRETSEAMSYGLAIPAAFRELFHFRPGQHITVRASIGGETVERTYSISNEPGDALLWITIKQTPGGVFSTWAHATLTTGMTLEAMPPAGRFVLAPGDGTPRRVVAIAAGSGITPLAGILEQAMAEPGTRATLLYGNRAVDQIIFRERLERLKDRHLERLQVFHVLSRDAEADVPVLAGRVDADKIKALLAGANCPRAGDQVFLCGPDNLIKDARDALIAMGTPRAAIHFEFFKHGPQSAAPARRTAALSQPEIVTAGTEVVALLDGVRKTFRVAEGQHVIDAALAAGIRLPYSCKGGMCCTCRAKLVEGEVDMDRNFSLEPWEIAAGFVLTCQARPRTPRLVLDYDQV